jgi:hypothetical protein
MSKAELSRRTGLRPENVRRLLVDGSADPQLSSVLAMLRSLKMGLAVLPKDDVPSDDDVLVGWLAHYGAPLYGLKVTKNSQPVSVEEALARGLALARTSGTVARALPAVFWANRNKLDFQLLRTKSEELVQGKALGFFLDLTSVLAGKELPSFKETADSLRARYSPLPLLARPVQFFTPTTRLERPLAELCTPAVARRWGFLMNMDLECFASLFRKATV